MSQYTGRIERVMNGLYDDSPTGVNEWRYLAELIDGAEGFVYLMQMETTPYYKIGRSKYPQERVTQLGGATLPMDIVLLHVISTDNDFELEDELHKRFKKKKHRGEWYLLGTADIEYIRGLDRVEHENIRDAKLQLRLYEYRNAMDVRTAPIRRESFQENQSRKDKWRRTKEVERREYLRNLKQSVTGQYESQDSEYRIRPYFYKRGDE